MNRISFLSIVVLLSLVSITSLFASDEEESKPDDNCLNAEIDETTDDNWQDMQPITREIPFEQLRVDTRIEITRARSAAEEAAIAPMIFPEWYSKYLQKKSNSNNPNFTYPAKD